MQVIRMHISFAQLLNCSSVYPVCFYKSEVQWPSLRRIIFRAKYKALAARFEGVYDSILYSINGNSIKY